MTEADFLGDTFDHLVDDDDDGNQIYVTDPPFSLDDSEPTEQLPVSDNEFCETWEPAITMVVDRERFKAALHCLKEEGIYTDKDGNIHNVRQQWENCDRVKIKATLIDEALKKLCHGDDGVYWFMFERGKEPLYGLWKVLNSDLVKSKRWVTTLCKDGYNPLMSPRQRIQKAWNAKKAAREAEARQAEKREEERVEAEKLRTEEEARVAEGARVAEEKRKEVKAATTKKKKKRKREEEAAAAAPRREEICARYLKVLEPVVQEAVRKGDHNRIRQMAVAGLTGKDTDAFEMADSYGNTPLISAVIAGLVDVCRVLVEEAGAGVDVASYDGDGYNVTALYTAAQYGNLDMCRFLVQRGANVNATDTDGNSVVFMAAHYGHETVCRYLIDECDADFKQVNKDGDGPLSIVTNYHEMNPGWLTSDCKNSIINYLKEAHRRESGWIAAVAK